jgi:hypothetical protein
MRARRLPRLQCGSPLPVLPRRWPLRLLLVSRELLQQLTFARRALGGRVVPSAWMDSAIIRMGLVIAAIAAFSTLPSPWGIVVGGALVAVSIAVGLLRK